jgi:hypothetical protein
MKFGYNDLILAGPEDLVYPCFSVLGSLVTITCFWLALKIWYIHVLLFCEVWLQ